MSLLARALGLERAALLVEDSERRVSRTSDRSGFLEDSVKHSLGVKLAYECPSHLEEPAKFVLVLGHGHVPCHGFIRLAVAYPDGAPLGRSARNRA